MESVYILAAARTAIGSFGGSLKSKKAVELGGLVMDACFERSGADKTKLDEIFFGCVLQGGLGQNVARQASILAGVPESVPSTTINQVCGSGLKSVGMASASIKAGDSQLVMCGGTENMSKSGYLLEEAREGHRMGHKSVIDLMIRDGLWDAMNDFHMGITAENVVDQYELSREEQDLFAVASQNKAEAAINEGKFKDEIVPVVLRDRKGNETVFDTDEYVRFGSTLEKVSRLRPAFKKDGSVTAANASGINDGAAALLLASEEFIAENEVKPMAKVLSYGSIGLDPKVMGLGPIEAIRKVLKKADVALEDVDLFEVNEAFASQSIAVVRELGLDPDKVNVNGGSIALGHPIGASGARILVTLLHEMKKRGSRYGVAALCIGGGQGTAVLVENMM